MKNIVKILAALLFGGLFTACELDNYEEPESSLTGQLLYQGEPIRVEYDRVSYELFQDGFGKVGPIGSSFTQDGELSQILFDGEYKMIIPVGQGPFVPVASADGTPDTTVINLRGSQDLMIEVTPYWMIRNTQLSAGEGSVAANFSLEQVASGDDAREVERVILYVSTTAFANSQTNVAFNTIEGGDIEDVNNVSVDVTVPDIQPTQDYVFASVAVKIAGVEDLIFSPTERLEL